MRRRNRIIRAPRVGHLCSAVNIPEGDKWIRMEAQTPRFEAGHVLLPKEAPWLAGFPDELLAFPRGRHDNRVDSVSQFLKWAWADSRRSRRVGGGGFVVTHEGEIVGRSVRDLCAGTEGYT